MRALDEGRYELKYAVPAARREEMLAVVAQSVTPDPNGREVPGGGRGYIVHSTYYDTPDLLDYTARLSAFRVRRRTRIRTYGAPGDRAPVFLELKRKLDDQVIKQRHNVCDADTWATLGDPPWAQLYDSPDADVQAMARRFGDVVAKIGLVPWVSVHYNREVYVDPTQPQVRLTIDRQITASASPTRHDLYPEPTLDVLPPEVFVVELKFNGSEPSWMRGLVRALDLRAEPISKYALSIARMRPEHPHELHRLLPAQVRRAA